MIFKRSSKCFFASSKSKVLRKYVVTCLGRGLIKVCKVIFSLGTTAVFEMFPKPRGEFPLFQFVSLNSGSLHAVPRSPSVSLYFHTDLRGMIVTSRDDPDWLIAFGLTLPPISLGSEPSVV